MQPILEKYLTKLFYELVFLALLKTSIFTLFNQTVFINLSKYQAIKEQIPASKNSSHQHANTVASDTGTIDPQS